MSSKLKLFENERTNKIILYIILIALIITSAIIIFMIVMQFVPLEETEGG